jgi:hypothetical protein
MNKKDILEMETIAYYSSFNGLPVHIEIYNGAYYMDTYCTL